MEKSPQLAAVTWGGATVACIGKIVGGQKGWRLPSNPELASLTDPSVAPPGPVLRPVIRSWELLRRLNIGRRRRTQTHSVPGVEHELLLWQGGHSNKKDILNFWCVRGAMNADAY